MKKRQNPNPLNPILLMASNHTRSGGLFTSAVLTQFAVWRYKSVK
jgi:hypothetical protein